MKDISTTASEEFIGHFSMPKDEGSSEMALKKASKTDNKMNHFGYPEAFISALDQVIQTNATPQTEGALLIFAFSNLPMIIHGYGFEASEIVLSKVEEAILDVIGEQDKVYRIQRDEFGILFQNVDKEELYYMASRIMSHVQQWCNNNNEYGSMHLVTHHVAQMLPTEAASVQEALGKSYIALNEIKRSNANVMTLRSNHEDPEYEAAFSRQEMGLASYLNQSILENRLVMAYQPIISAKDGSVEHYEALLRIRNNDGKISSAGALIPIAERMGLIDVIDDITLKMVVEELKRDDKVKIAFNISNLTTQNTQWLCRFSELISKNPEIAPRLIVEITETAAQRDMQQTSFFVAEIQALGCQVALDDFGSGYTSFRQLKSLSVDMVKIDGAFVKDLVDNADNRFFVKTLLEFTNGFGLTSVAEYVENGEIAKMLMELGVHMLQGYYFGRPQIHRPWLHEGEYSIDHE